MAKHITKSVTEDIAYEFKRVGLAVHAHQTGSMPEDIAENYELDLGDPEEVIDWLVSSLHDVLAEHDPTFDSVRWNAQTQYRVTN